jgi:hypothetical protein
MPWPQMPVLPDDDPIEALRLMREYWHQVADCVAPYWLFIGVFAPPTFPFVISWALVGFYPTVFWASDFVPITFAVISVVVSVRRLREEHQSVVILSVLVLGLLGTMVLHFDRQHIESVHNTQIDGLNNRIESVGKQNELLLRAYLEKPATSSSEAEMERRKGVQKALRNEYILSQPHVSEGLLAGTEYPPADWMNKRLRELGENWTFAEAPATGPRGNITAEPLEVRGQKLCESVLDFAREAKQEEPVMVFGPGVSREAMDAQAVESYKTNARLGIEFDKRFGAEYSAIKKELEATGIKPDLTVGDPPPNPYEIELAGKTLCNMVYAYRQKEKIPDLHLQAKIKTYQTLGPCMGNPVQNDPFPDEWGDQVGTRAISMSYMLLQKADECIHTMQSGKQDSDSVRRSYAADIRLCCRDKIMQLHQSILSRCPPATDQDGELAYSMFLTETLPKNNYPSCNAENLAKYLRDMGTQIKDAYEMMRH